MFLQPGQHPDLALITTAPEEREALLRVSMARRSYFSMWTPSGVVGWL